MLFDFFNIRFSVIHDLEKPNDEKALALMNSCAAAVLEEYPDIVFSYGFNDEYRYYNLFPSIFCVLAISLYY